MKTTDGSVDETEENCQTDEGCVPTVVGGDSREPQEHKDYRLAAHRHHLRKIFDGRKGLPRYVPLHILPHCDAAKDNAERLPGK